MKNNKKLKGLNLMLLGFVFLFISTSNLNAQSTIQERFSAAVNSYWEDDYERAFALLEPILESFDQQRDYWLQNPKLVFQVFKVITESYYEEGMDDEVDYAESILIDFFVGHYTPNQVIDRLDNTEIPD